MTETTDRPSPDGDPPRPARTPRRSLWLSVTWEHAASAALSAFHLHSIKAKIVVFALLATLIPSVSTAWMANRQSAQSIAEKIDEELRNAASQSAREADLWLREREYDVQVLSTRDVVYDNLGANVPAAAGLERLARLRGFLTSVHGRIADYEELLVLDVTGAIVASTGDESTPPPLPVGWQDALRQDRVLIGEPYVDEALGRWVMLIVVPVRSVDVFDGQSIGMVAGKVNLDALRGILQSFTVGPSGETFLVASGGQVVVSSEALLPGDAPRLSREVLRAVLAEDSTAIPFVDPAGHSVIGMAGRLPRLEWGAVATMPETVAFARVRELRQSTMLIVFVLLAVVGLIAYYLALMIVRPLDRLTAGAAVVAGGDLEVDLPVVGGGEVGYLTSMFNDMVARLRHGREELDVINEELRTKNLELERRSVTDGLTGLFNRRHLMETLAVECVRSRRTERVFSLLMIDVDHFKKFNDTHGHLAGDDALEHVGSVLREVSREADCVARYGGEEFVLLLPETDLDGAVVLGDRIRSRLAERPVELGSVSLPLTVSAGVSEFPANGEDPEALIARADEALYSAKKKGRDQVVRPTRRAKRRAKSNKTKT